MHAIQVKEFGGPEQLVYAEVPRPEPRAGEVCVEVEAAGVNFIDVYQRTGAYPLALPLVLGQEAAGRIVAVGEDVAGVKEGDRVAFASQMGAYAEYVVVPAASNRRRQTRRLPYSQSSWDAYAYDYYATQVQ